MEKPNFETGFHLDFRTKLFVTVVLSYTLLLGNLQERFLVVAIGASSLPYLLLLLARRYQAAIRGIGLIIGAVLVQKYLMGHVTGVVTSICLFITMLILRLLPGFVMGKYSFMTTDISELIYSLKKLRLPDQMIIPMTVMSRFFYTAKTDYQQIKEAMYLQGLTSKRLLTQPVKLIEYRTIPLLMVLMRTADDVAVSALTRGLVIGKKRTSLVETHFTWRDGVMFFCMVVLIGFYLGGKYA
ncbi:energy-coupling factor transport system permease protein [Granulicatella balaenopterae]|uniref:Energy-coupling factor transport system permease protein n=1 Tax=Granulicatella balaenopterae TaxID=137733 RepID=A0A1H9IZS7_9LACT|nr:energy-coupling factor transporter transmembrane component T [Granulicatella balaenopterae]SEQ79865.1 energy-coupling factor transport system permease protein [Granulicatella balaenopterae]